MSSRHNSNGNPYIYDHAGHVPGTPDIARRWLVTGNPRWRPEKTEAAITFEWLEITTPFQLLPQIFDQAQLGYDTVDIAPDILRHRPPTDFKMAATETGS